MTFAQVPKPASFIAFREVPAPGITKRWEIRTTRGDVVIGRISWSTGWRKYVLAPGYPTDWDEGCLREVSDFLEHQTHQHKNAAAVRHG